MQQEFREPRFIIHADVPMSIRINWFQITDLDGDPLFGAKWLDDCLAWLREHDESKAWLKTTWWTAEITIHRRNSSTDDILTIESQDGRSNERAKHG